MSIFCARSIGQYEVRQRNAKWKNKKPYKYLVLLNNNTGNEWFSNTYYHSDKLLNINVLVKLVKPCILYAF